MVERTEEVCAQEHGHGRKHRCADRMAATLQHDPESDEGEDGRNEQRAAPQHVAQHRGLEIERGDEERHEHDDHEQSRQAKQVGRHDHRESRMKTRIGITSPRPARSHDMEQQVAESDHRHCQDECDNDAAAGSRRPAVSQPENGGAQREREIGRALTGSASNAALVRSQ